jgi:hypothetical protein
MTKLISRTAILLALLTGSAHAQGINDGFNNGHPTIFTSPQSVSPTYAPQIYQPRQPSYGVGAPTYTPPGLQPPRPNYGGYGNVRRTFPSPLDDDD